MEYVVLFFKLRLFWKIIYTLFKTIWNQHKYIIKNLACVFQSFSCLYFGHSYCYWPFKIQTSMSWNIICFCTTFFFLYLMGHILILLRSACLCAVLIFSSSLMHCCIIYIPQYNKPPPPALTQSHISPRAIPLGGIGRIDHIAGAVDLWEMGRHCGCHILIPPPWLRPFDAWRGSTRLTYSKSSTLVHTLLLSPFFLHWVRESRCRSSCHTCLDKDEEYIWGEDFPSTVSLNA